MSKVLLFIAKFNHCSDKLHGLVDIISPFYLCIENSTVIPVSYKICKHSIWNNYNRFFFFEEARLALLQTPVRG